MSKIKLISDANFRILCSFMFAKKRKLFALHKVFGCVFYLNKHYLSFCFIKLTFFYLNAYMGDIFLLFQTLGLLVRNINVLLRGKIKLYII